MRARTPTARAQAHMSDRAKAQRDGLKQGIRGRSGNNQSSKTTRSKSPMKQAALNPREVRRADMIRQGHIEQELTPEQEMRKQKRLLLRDQRRTQAMTTTSTNGGPSLRSTSVPRNKSVQRGDSTPRKSRFGPKKADSSSSKPKSRFGPRKAPSGSSRKEISAPPTHNHDQGPTTLT
eukprot:CAMPEP_0114370526 /NCGR_PEP_ID=MMETSP0101-20121206/32572_1 /TAXON_ID=38822 ORGANISM="Pteridomonas danica, Strain PT" /NCGR_SAMPLE_ID=MMETSP0101 /ASSEMBLY_ACC=CAM_ASM_000211 /LENGTH=176 /DNA_ID=CAMNT_0001522091 /DNA_START=121 /DNA_END=648 /DNA_ORIENTATION=-